MNLEHVLCILGTKHGNINKNLFPLFFIDKSFFMFNYLFYFILYVYIWNLLQWYFFRNTVYLPITIFVLFYVSHCVLHSSSVYQKRWRVWGLVLFYAISQNAWSVDMKKIMKKYFIFYINPMWKIFILNLNSYNFIPS